MPFTDLASAMLLILDGWMSTMTWREVWTEVWMHGCVEGCVDPADLHLQNAAIQHLHDALGRHRCRLCRILCCLFSLRSRLGSAFSHGVHTFQGGRIVAMLCASGGRGMGETRRKFGGSWSLALGQGDVYSTDAGEG